MMRKKTISIPSILFLLTCVQSAHAFTWKDLWYTPDQQGARLFAHGKPLDAAEKFADPRWKGIAYYRAGQYEQAEKVLKNAAGIESKYNLANALAHRGQYSEAIILYDEVLKDEPRNHDAAYNKKLLEKLLAKQKKNQRQSSSSKSTSDQKKNDGSGNRAGSEMGSGSNSNTDNSNLRNQVKPNQSSENDTTQNANQAAGSDGISGASGSSDSSRASGKENDLRNGLTNTQGNQPTPSSGDGDVPFNTLTPEKQQSENHWLRRIPDDPGGLLRQKFLRDYLRNQNQQGILR